MPNLTAHNLKTHYHDIGRQDRVLLLLHGWGHSWDSWAGLIPSLSAHYRLIIPDLPGFGETESPNQGWDTWDYVTWLKDFLQSLGISELHAVIGHSYGGKVAAFSWLSQEPNTIEVSSGIFLIAPSGIPRKLSWRTQLFALLLHTIPYSIRRKLLQPVRAWYYTTILHERDYLTATPYQEKTLQKILSEDIRAHSAQPSLQRLRLCWGEKDPVVPLWMAYEYARLSQDSHVFVVQNTGHFPQHTHQSLILNWLETWL